MDDRVAERLPGGETFVDPGSWPGKNIGETIGVLPRDEVAQWRF